MAGQATREQMMSNRERVFRCASMLRVSTEPLLGRVAALLFSASATWPILPMSIRHATLALCDEIDGGAASREK